MSVETKIPIVVYSTGQDPHAFELGYLARSPNGDCWIYKDEEAASKHSSHVSGFRIEHLHFLQIQVSNVSGRELYLYMPKSIFQNYVKDWDPRPKRPR